MDQPVRISSCSKAAIKPIAAIFALLKTSWILQSSSICASMRLGKTASWNFRCMSLLTRENWCWSQRGSGTWWFKFTGWLHIRIQVSWCFSYTVDKFTTLNRFCLFQSFIWPSSFFWTSLEVESTWQILLIWVRQDVGILISLILGIALVMIHAKFEFDRLVLKLSYISW